MVQYSLSECLPLSAVELCSSACGKWTRQRYGVRRFSCTRTGVPLTLQGMGLLMPQLLGDTAKHMYNVPQQGPSGPKWPFGHRRYTRPCVRAPRLHGRGRQAQTTGKVTPYCPGTAPRRFMCSCWMKLVLLARQLLQPVEPSVQPHTSVLVDGDTTHAPKSKTVWRTEEP